MENTKVTSRKELKIPFSVLFSILKEKFPNELKEVSSSIIVEFLLNNDLNSEEFLTCSWEENKTTENVVELNISKLTSEKLTEMARLAAFEEINDFSKKV